MRSTACRSGHARTMSASADPRRGRGALLLLARSVHHALAATQGPGEFFMIVDLHLRHCEVSPQAGGLINDHRSESFPDYLFGAVYHLIDDACGAHQSVCLTDWIVTPFPFPHDAIARPASRSVGEFRTEDQTPSRVPDAGSDDLVLVSWMGVGFEAREEPSPHPDRVGRADRALLRIRRFRPFQPPLERSLVDRT
jgi:hypothetical protein